MDNTSLWNAVLGELEVSLSKANFTTWLKNTCLISREDCSLIVGVPNIFTKEWLEKKYNTLIETSVKNILGAPPKITYKVGSIKTLAEEAKRNESPAKEDRPEKPSFSNEPTTPGQKIDLNNTYSFDNYVVGESNKLAFAACQAIANMPGKKYNPLFIYGGVGLGKTHLSQAVGNEIKKQDKDRKIVYVSSEKFTNDFISSISNKKTTDFKNKYRKADVLIIDDMQFLAGKEQTQEEFFHTFNALHQSGKQIIITSDRPPKAIPTLEDRLRSRFEWGLMVDVQAPDLETRIAILQKKALMKGWNFPLESIDYVARSIQQNIRELEGALNRIIAYCELTSTHPTLDNTKRVLNSILNNSKKKTISGKDIIEQTAKFYDLKREDLLGSKRDKEIVVPRQIAMYLLREELSYSYPRIAKELNKKDHTTAMHACLKIEKQLEINEPLHHEINLLKERIYTGY